jgi:hypothetical protein
MVRAAAIFGLGREFDDFLFAPIGEEPNGMSLSVVSALARSNVDPWQEAAKLARLPAKTATQRLAALIGALPGMRSAEIDPGAIAARLIALLPRPIAPQVTSHEQLLTGVAPQFPAARSIVTYAVLLALLMGAESILAGHQPPPLTASTVAPAPGPIAPQSAKVPSSQ